MEIGIILLLIVLNGVFAMAEIAVVSARKSKLQHQASEGSKRAKAALALAQAPNRFLSTVQIGITFVGIFAGAFGAETIAENLSTQWKSIPFISPYSEALSLVVVVSVITYLSLIIGELVPKRLALTNPELIAKIVARPMNLFSEFMSPLVTLLSVSTDSLLRLMRIKDANDTSVSEDEVRMLIREGAKTGVFEKTEKDIVERTFLLGDKKVNTLMTSRKEIVWLDIDGAAKTTRNKIAKYPHSHYPVCRNGIDKVVGTVRTEDMLASLISDEQLDLQKQMYKPLLIPESMSALKTLELFKKSGIHMAIIIDEYGNVQGLLSLNDIFEAIVGSVPSIVELNDKAITKRKDGSALVDGLVSIDEFKEYFQIKKFPEEKSGFFYTIGGFVMHKLGKVPAIGEIINIPDYSIEIVDMDANRVDKLLVTPVKKM